MSCTDLAKIALLCLGLGSYTLSLAQSCPDKGIYLQVLGSGGPELDDAMASSGYAVWADGKIRVLVDTGTGTAENFGRTGKPFSQVALILFSHFHTDHSADFAAHIKNSFFEFRDKDLWVYGPDENHLAPSTKTFVHRFIGENGVFPYLSEYLHDGAAYRIHLHNVSSTSTVQKFSLQDISFSAIDAEHGAFPSLAWRVEIGGKSMTFSGDNNGKSNNLVHLAKNTDLLVIHNAVPPEITGVAKRLHMTPARISKISQSAKPKALLLSHFMKRTKYLKQSTQAIISQHYPKKVNFATDLACYAVGK